jgi:hypothetical protein
VAALMGVGVVETHVDVANGPCRRVGKDRRCRKLLIRTGRGLEALVCSESIDVQDVLERLYFSIESCQSIRSCGQAANLLSYSNADRLTQGMIGRE